MTVSDPRIENFFDVFNVFINGVLVPVIVRQVSWYSAYSKANTDTFSRYIHYDYFRPFIQPSL